MGLSSLFRVVLACLAALLCVLPAVAADEVAWLEAEIAKCDALITSSNALAVRALQARNAKAEGVARQAVVKAQAAKAKLQGRLGAVREQAEFEKMNDEWVRKQNELIGQRLKEPNRYAAEAYRSLKMNAPPPLVTKEYDGLEPGDVILIHGDGVSKSITWVDGALSQGEKQSNASHTVIYLKTVNGKKYFLDNQRNEGPRVISEDLFLETYGSHREEGVGRGAEVAKLPARLAQPLRQDQGEALFKAAVEMAQRNNQDVVQNLKRGSSDTHYGVRDGDIVCSEASWALINQVGIGRLAIPETPDLLKRKLGVSFSPADFKNSPYFFVTNSFLIP